MIKIIASLFFILLMHDANAQTTKIIAHRGAWKEFKLPENSIAALSKAIELKCDGAEFDVRMTLDGVLVVNHDPTYFGDTIQTNTYAYLNRNKLSNGEDLPTLAQYFKAGKKGRQNTKLICEIKAAISATEQDRLATLRTVALAKKMNLEDAIVYISFSSAILDWIKEAASSATVLYLESDLTINQVVAHQFDGINYHYSHFKKYPNLAMEAKNAQLKTGSWTVNELEDLEMLVQQGVTLITTNQPAEFQNYLRQKVKQ
jgi:glycerophosphoryl diester phosphodiesterase